MRLTVLVLGGYGNFGGRIVHLLAAEPQLTLLVGGRSMSRAAAFCGATLSAAVLKPVCIDRDAEMAPQLGTDRPDIVVDATGPFQAYGTDPYRVVTACLDLGIHYLDLADASDFVEGITRFDELARARNTFVLAGASTFPVLTAAVVRDLARGMTRLRTIRAGIAPSPHAYIGSNVVRAIASYAGKPVRIVRGGRIADGSGIIEAMRETIAPPGCMPLRNTRFVLVDVPDLRLFPTVWPKLEAIWMGAGPSPESLQRILGVLAWLVRLKILPSSKFLARPFHTIGKRVRWGEHRGGMFVAVAGDDDRHEPIERSWHLLAEGDAGPLIPSMAVAGIVQRVLEGRPPQAGARACLSELELADYHTMFEGRQIYTGTREDNPRPSGPLFRLLLGSSWQRLPQPLRLGHSAPRDLAGTAQIERGKSVLGRAVACLFGFPPTGRDVAVSVSMRVVGREEVWSRRFGSHTFSSRLSEGKGRSKRLLVERFGPFSFGLALVWDGDRLHYVVRRWAFLGVALPPALAPSGESFESLADGDFGFHVEIRHALTGLIVRYRGSLRPI